jgi:hypothetical protein
VIGSYRGVNDAATFMYATSPAQVNALTPDVSTELLDQFTGRDKKQLNKLYREIYQYDSVSGSAVDLIANLPFGDFTITGMSDPKMVQVYEDCMHELKVPQFLNACTISYLVLGELISTLLFNEKKGIFTDTIIHDPDTCEVNPIPLKGYSPKIDLKLSKDMQKFIRSTDPRDREAQKEIPSKLMQQMIRGGKVALEPESTIYLARSPVPGVGIVSYFSRVLPFWLIEKALIRGTIIGAWRRQRSILHLTVGTDEWEATAAQLQELVNLFISADLDPQGAVIATRQGVETSDVRPGADFWRIEDDWDTLSNVKMRALGINEGFLSGEASYNTMEVALSVFVENLKALREFMMRHIFYEKIFPLLSRYHGFKRQKRVNVEHRYRVTGSVKDYYVPMHASKESRYVGDYVIPEIVWHKQLSPESDAAYLELLKAVQEAGLPIPLAMLASAAGISIDRVLAHRTMLEAGLKKKDRQNKALVDEISATIILQTYLENKRFSFL